MVDIFKCYTCHPIYTATESLLLGPLRKGGSNHHFQGTIDNKKILIKTVLASNLLCIYNRICHWDETENQVLTPTTSEDELQIDQVHNSTLPMNLSRMETVLFFYAKSTQNQETLKVRDDKQFPPIMSRSDQ